LNQGCVDYRKEYPKYRTTTFSEAFWKGFHDSIKLRFEKYKEKSYGLVVYDPVQEFINSLGLFNVRLYTDSTYGIEAGIVSGYNVQLRQGVETKKEKQGLLK